MENSIKPILKLTIINDVIDIESNQAPTSNWLENDSADLLLDQAAPTNNLSVDKKPMLTVSELVIQADQQGFVLLTDNGPFVLQDGMQFMLGEIAMQAHIDYHETLPAPEPDLPVFEAEQQTFIDVWQTANNQLANTNTATPSQGQDIWSGLLPAQPLPAIENDFYQSQKPQLDSALSLQQPSMPSVNNGNILQELGIHSNTSALEDISMPRSRDNINDLAPIDTLEMYSLYEQRQVMQTPMPMQPRPQAQGKSLLTHLKDFTDKLLG